MARICMTTNISVEKVIINKKDFACDYINIYMIIKDVVLFDNCKYLFVKGLLEILYNMKKMRPDAYKQILKVIHHIY